MQQGESVVPDHIHDEVDVTYVQGTAAVTAVASRQVRVWRVGRFTFSRFSLEPSRVRLSRDSGPDVVLRIRDWDKLVRTALPMLAMVIAMLIRYRRSR